MKQRMEAHQWHQLTKEERGKLHQYWFDESFEREEQTPRIEVDGMSLPLWSIGEMMAYMRDNQYRINLDNAIPCSVFVPKLLNQEFCEMEIVDALWEAIKATLPRK